MLRTDVVYQNEDQGIFSLTIEGAPGGLAARLNRANFSCYRFLNGYVPWAESGFAMLAAAFAQFAPELAEENGTFTALEIRVTSTSANAAASQPLCAIALTCGPSGGRMRVDGPILRMTSPLSVADVPSNLGAALRYALKCCDPTIGNEPRLPATVPAYSGGAAEPFVFVSELPDDVQSWFVAMTKLSNPTALQRHGQTVTAKAYADFCAGHKR